MATGYSEAAGPEVLRIVHIFGPMVMLAIGVGAASLAFAGEHIYCRYEKRKKRDQLQQKRFEFDENDYSENNQSEENENVYLP